MAELEKSILCTALARGYFVMSVTDNELVTLGAGVNFWERKVAEIENAPDRYNLSQQEALRQARQQLRQAQKVLREVKRNVQLRLF